MAPTSNVEASAGKRLRDLREAADLSRRELAELAGVATRTVAYVEDGEGVTQPRVRFALAAALGEGVETIWPVGRDQMPALVRERMRRGLSASKAADEIGVTTETLLRFEAGEAKRPRRGTVEAIAGYYGLPLDDVAPTT